LSRKVNKSTAAGDRGQETRERIVHQALQLAAVKGLGGISIGSLAQKLHMSKSGLFAHFNSKQNLQIAVIERARLLFFDHVVVPPEEAGLKGIERLWALCDRWLSFVENSMLPGGYFFTGAFFQCAGQEGAVSRQVTDIVRRWVDTLRVAVDEARSKSDLQSHVDAKQAALELNAILIGAHCSVLLRAGHQEWARSAILGKLAALATKEIPSSAFESLKRWRKYLESMHH
jgi:AcrR family transcriptional regulator